MGEGEIALNNNFKFDENTRKFSKRVENTGGKWEIGSCEQFLLFPQCFQKACFPEASKGVIVWEWVKYSCKNNCLFLMPYPGRAVVSVSDTWPGGCEFDPWLRRHFFPAYFHLLQTRPSCKLSKGGTDTTGNQQDILHTLVSRWQLENHAAAA